MRRREFSTDCWIFSGTSQLQCASDRCFRISKLSLISSIIANLKGKETLVSEASSAEKLMTAKLLCATESFVNVDAQELEQFVPRQFETQLSKRALPLSYILRTTPTAADGSKS